MRIRMLLNENENIFIEGDLRRGKKAKYAFLPFLKEDFYTLENITTSSGFTVQTKGGIIEMDKLSYDTNKNTVPFLINGLTYNNMPYSVRREIVTQWFHDGSWRINSEYDSSVGSRKNAYILLIMDTSLSFATQMGPAKETASEIIMFISEQM